MKSLKFSVLVVFYFLASIYSEARSPLVQHLYGDAGVVLYDTLEAAIEGNLNPLKDSLSSAYLQTVSASELTGSLTRSDWKLEKFTVLSMSKFEGVRCFVVDFTFYAQNGNKVVRYHSTDPAFVKLQGEEWKLWNFPFAPSIARNFPKERFCLSPEKGRD